MQSKTIRMHIGLARSHIRHVLEEVDELSDEQQIQEMSADDVYVEVERIVDVSHRINVEIAKIQKLEDSWKTLMLNNPSEKHVYDDYIVRLGDYKDNVRAAKETLDNLQKVYDLCITLHRERAEEPHQEYPAFGCESSTLQSIQLDQEADNSATLPHQEFNQGTVHRIVHQQQLNQEVVNSATLPRQEFNQGTVNGTVRQQQHNQVVVQSATLQPPEFSHGAVNWTAHQPVQSQGAILPNALNLQQPNQAIFQGTTGTLSIKMPLISLPTFDGDFTQFHSFMELFTSLVDLQPINNIAKFHYLQSSLSGPAKMLIKHIPLLGENYQLARQLLYKQYGDTTRTRHHLQRQMQALPSMTFNKNNDELQDFWSTASSILFQWKSIQPECDNSTTADIICSKLPERYIEKLFTGRNAGKMYNASQVLDKVSEYVQGESLVITICANSKSNDRKVTTMSTQQQNQNAVKDKHQGKGQKKLSTCIFCSSQTNQHRYESCPSYPTAADRQKRAKELKLCYKCLQANHVGKQCLRPRNCFHCQGEHHSSLCLQKKNGQTKNQQQPQQSKTNASSGINDSKPPFFKKQGSNHKPPQTCAVTISQDERDYQPSTEDITITLNACSIQQPTTRPIAMMAVETFVEDHQGDLIGNTTFFDSGSDRSYISKKLSDRLGLTPIDSQRIHIQTFGDSEVKTINANRYLVTFHIQDQKVSIPLTEIPTIANSITVCHVNREMKLNIFEDPSVVLPRSTEEPGILIGLDHMNKILGSTSSSLLPNGTTLHHTNCGNIITGTEKPAAALTNENSTMSSVGILHTDPEQEHQELRTMLEKFWSLEHSLVFENPRTSDEEQAYKFFNETTTREDNGRYICRWPFIDPEASLPDNYYLAQHRLQSTIKRLQKDPQLYLKYDQIIKEQLDREFIEVVERSSSEGGNRIHYLSHHPVLKPTSTSTKVRIVYDASAKASRSSKSLNDLLHAGQSLLPKINEILVRLREPEILISSDLEKAFLMVALHPEDRDTCRFLWTPPEESEPVCYRFRRIPFGIKTSPYILNSTIKRHLEEHNSRISHEILKNIYVDNIFHGVNTVEEGMDFYHKAKSIFSSAQMKLTQFVTNSSQLNTMFTKAEELESEPSCDQKLLGIRWNTEEDTISIGFAPPIQGHLSKRKILQHLATTYDPLGILAPVVLQSKLFSQRLWERSASWDESLTDEEIQDWRSIEEKSCGNPIILRRKYFSTPTTKEHTFDLQLFGDASAAAFGAVAYLRRLGPKSIETAFVSAQSTVAPLKKTLSIPQAELLAIERCARLAHNLKKQLDWEINSVTIWSDSLCSLDQVASNKAGTIFGRNRLREINKLVPTAIFSHIPGKLNPADVLSRSCSLEELRNHPLWWKGPPFLMQEKLPIRNSSIQAAITMAVQTTNEENQPILNLDPERFSSIQRMFNVIKRLLGLFVKDATLLDAKAKHVLLKLAQQLNPPDEGTIRSLHLEKQNDLWFYSGRIPGRSLPYLPAHRIAKLYVTSIHLKNMHSSPLYTLPKIRNEVWIPGGKSFVNKVIKNCHQCRVRLSKPTYQPDFPNLPDSRTQWHAPFTFVGMDYCGPLKATNNGETRKYWIILFTCLTTRYTVVELVTSLDADNLLRIIRRVSSTYGTPKEIITDNAAQIKMLAKTTEAAEAQLTSGTTSSLPIFRFIPAHSPWSGGVYERMVGLLKACLVKSGTTRRLMTEEDFRTLLKEAEAIVNQRPLTFVSLDDIRPLCPMDFVFPNRRNSNLLTMEETVDPTILRSSHGELLESWTQTSSITRYFISRWREDYIQLLQERNQITHSQDKLANRDALQVGDIVIFESEQHKESWPLARVEEVGTRAAKLYCPRTKRIVEQPFKRIYRLEAANYDQPKSDKGQIQSTAEPPKNTLQEKQSIDLPTAAPTSQAAEKSTTRSGKSYGKGDETQQRSKRKYGATHLSTTFLVVLALTTLIPSSEAVPLELAQSLAKSLVQQTSKWTDNLYYAAITIVVLAAIFVTTMIIQFAMATMKGFKMSFKVLKWIIEFGLAPMVYIIRKMLNRNRIPRRSKYRGLIITILCLQQVILRSENF